MIKLLRANFTRMRKDKIFWLCFAASAVFGILRCVSGSQRMNQYHFEVTLESQIFPSFCFIGIASAVFSSIFIGTEYGDGTIRNKVIVGSTRDDIYLSNLITCAAASVLIECAYLAAVCAAGIPMFGFFTLSPLAALLWLAIGLLMTIAFAALFCLLAMLNQNKALTAIFSLLFVFAALIFSVYLYSRLGEPEFVQSISISTNADGTTMYESGGDSSMPNPLYIGDTQRAVYQTLLDILPAGQGVQLMDCNVVHPELMLVYSVLIIAGSTVAGVFVFRRKDLK